MLPGGSAPKPECLFRQCTDALFGLLIVSTLQQLPRLIHVAVGINKVNEVAWHSQTPEEGGSATLSVTDPRPHPTPPQIIYSVTMKLFTRKTMTEQLETALAALRARADTLRNRHAAAETAFADAKATLQRPSARQPAKS